MWGFKSTKIDSLHINRVKIIVGGVLFFLRRTPELPALSHPLLRTTCDAGLNCVVANAKHPPVLGVQAPRLQPAPQRLVLLDHAHQQLSFNTLVVCKVQTTK